MELKPCPFCGSQPSIILFAKENSSWHVYQVMCFSCNVKPKIFGRSLTKARAIEAWNRRTNNGSC